MLHTLQLKDLAVGKTDAKNELAEDNQSERDRFIESFLIPENINISDFIDGKRYFITGLKGTGKTALLRYIQLQIQQNNPNATSFILFKTEFTEEDKSAFSRAANAFVALNTGEAENDEDFVNVWQWFLHRHMIKSIKRGQQICFADDLDWEKYVKCVSAPKLGNEESGIIRLFPKLKKGNVEVEGDMEFLKGKLGLEFEWDNEKDKQVKFSAIVKQANTLFTRLKPLNSKLFVFIDELELSLGKQKQYQKDIRLIRDLILSVNNLNNLSKSLKYPLHIVTAIRSEVLTAVQSAGKEINKPIIDFGITLKWQQSGGGVKDHPLIKIINKKLQGTEKSLKMNPISSDDEIWTKYFPAQVNNKSAQEYILHRTWYRPRDIVRLLSLAQQQFPNETQFTHKVFDSINKEYSTQSWIEHAEELRTSYSESEINGLKILLTGLKCPFNVREITIEAEAKREIYSDVDKLLNKHKIGDVLSHLYKVGIIGNTGSKVRYSFRGDDELLIDASMKVHDPLWNYLSIEIRN